MTEAALDYLHRALDNRAEDCQQSTITGILSRSKRHLPGDGHCLRGDRHCRLLTDFDGRRILHGVAATSQRPAKRRFIDLDHGQVHYWDLPTRDDSEAPLIMLHASPLSGRSLLPLASHLSPDRHVILLDLPGNGDSDGLGLPDPTVDDYAAVLADVVGALAPGGADLYGMHTGASMALGLALHTPGRVLRLVLEGLASFEAELRDIMLEHQAPVVVPDLEGRHLLWAWQYLRDSYLFFPWFDHRAERRRPLGLPAAEVLHERFVDVAKALGTYRHSYRASIRYPGIEKLGELHGLAVLLLATPSDMLRQATQAAAVAGGHQYAELPDDDSSGSARHACATQIEQWLQRTTVIVREKSKP